MRAVESTTIDRSVPISLLQTQIKINRPAGDDRQGDNVRRSRPNYSAAAGVTSVDANIYNNGIAPNKPNTQLTST